MKRAVLLASILALFVIALLATSRPSAANADEQSRTAEQSDQQQTEAVRRNELPALINSSRNEASDLEEENEPDLPKGRRGNIDETTYLRLRDEYVARLRGIEPGRPFDPGARGRAIQQMNQVEQLRAQRPKDSFFNKLSSAFGS